MGIQRSALVERSAAAMYRLVNDVEAYPRRFTWCEAAEILEQSDTHMVAKLEVRALGMRTGFTTRNTLVPETRIKLELVDGPFRHLTGAWEFDALGAERCRVELALEFEVHNRLLGAALGAGFHHLADRMVEDFRRVGEQR